MLSEGRHRVAMADVDAAGIIYYASPLRWAEVLFGNWLESVGHPISSMLAAGVATPVVSARVGYRSLLGLDDHCRLELRTERVGVTSFRTRCEVWGPREPKPAVEVLVTYVYVAYVRQGANGATGPQARKQPLPRWLQDALEAGLTPARQGGEK